MVGVVEVWRFGGVWSFLGFFSMAVVISERGGETLRFQALEVLDSRHRSPA